MNSFPSNCGVADSEAESYGIISWVFFLDREYRMRRLAHCGGAHTEAAIIRDVMTTHCLIPRNNSISDDTTSDTTLIPRSLQPILQH